MYTGPKLRLDGLLIHIDPFNIKYSQPTKLINAVDKNHETNAFSNVIYNNQWIETNGSTSVMTFPFYEKLNFDLEQSILMWIHCGTDSGNVRRNPYNQAYGGGGTISQETDGTFNYYFGTSGTDSQFFATSPSIFTVLPNELAFIAVTRSQITNQVVWYKNGKSINTGNSNNVNYPSVVTGTLPIKIGHGYINPFSGKIGMTSIYNKELTEKEIFDYYENTKLRYI